MTVTVERLDPRPGGAWRQAHRDATGRVHVFHGVFHGTPSPDGIVQTYEAEADPGPTHVFLTATTFEPRPGGTLLRQRTVFQSIEDRDGYVRAGMEVGVRQSMERLDELVSSPAREA